MKVLRLIRKCWRRLLQPRGNPTLGIDSHKWETKIEILSRLNK